VSFYFSDHLHIDVTKSEQPQNLYNNSQNPRNSSPQKQMDLKEYCSVFVRCSHSYMFNRLEEMNLILQPAINIGYQHGRLRTGFINASHLTREVMFIYPLRFWRNNISFPFRPSWAFVVISVSTERPKQEFRDGMYLRYLFYVLVLLHDSINHPIIFFDKLEVLMGTHP